MKKWILGLLVALVVSWLASTGFVTWRLTHRAKPPFPEPIPQWMSEAVESVRPRTRDGEEIGGWLMATEGAPVSVLLLHGQGSSRQWTSTIFAELIRRGGTNALAISMRGHGDSSGRAMDFGWSSRLDVETAVELLEGRFPGTRIFVVGQSLGAAAAIFASDMLGDRVEGYLLEAPYSNLESATRYRLQRHLPEGADEVALAGMRLWAGLLMDRPIEAYSPLDRVTGIPRGTPVRFLVGTEDDYVHLEEIEEMRKLCGESAELVRFEGASHEDLRAFDHEKYMAVLFGMIDPADARSVETDISEDQASR